MPAKWTYTLNLGQELSYSTCSEHMIVPVLSALDDLYQYDISYLVVKRISSLEGEDKQ